MELKLSNRLKCSMPSCPSNCTNMELKRMAVSDGEFMCRASNCTNMELKLNIDAATAKYQNASNCTNMELKPRNYTKRSQYSVHF